MRPADPPSLTAALPLALALGLLLAAPSSQAYGTRNWLEANQPWSKNWIRDSHRRGINFMSGAQRTGIWSEDDLLDWNYSGNLRNSNGFGAPRWGKREATIDYDSD